MKLRTVLIGFTSGVATGIITALMKSPRPAGETEQNFVSNSYETKSLLRQLKIEAVEVKDYVMKTKNESQSAMKTMGDEVKTMIATYKSDIDPNITHLKSNIENIKNRADEVKQTFSKK
ncbi:YtxH domain-containing protein [Macrococcus equipercicus]|uniref:YtxH domain-containing protein n=1 Tax=Macrococcus equipercicus TaxID=69967 RepID=A0ABQ6R7U1_9STAP|nr:YtxH domain-containing protein [Macrococcus equipercicus]KAA1039164.1 YtxH domain-containing protein [Macrococcus equipercicus]